MNNIVDFSNRKNKKSYHIKEIKAELGDDNANVGKLNVPRCNKKDMPAFFFTCSAIAEIGRGKTYSIGHLLRMYNETNIRDNDGECSLRTIILTPTYDNNAHIYDSIPNFDPDYDLFETPTDDTIYDILEDIEITNEETDNYIKIKELLKRLDRFKQGIKERFTNEEIELLNSVDWEMPEPPRFKKKIVNVLIVDDCISTPIIRQGKAILNQCVIKARHLKLNIIFASQSLKGLPKIIRVNTKVWMFFKFGGHKSVIEMYDEVGSEFESFDQFLEIFNHCTSKPYGFLVVDKTAEKGRRIKCGFDTIIQTN